MMASFLTALRFLTVLPVPLPRLEGDNDLARSMHFFPLVGLLIGVLAWGIFCIASRVLPGSLPVLVLLAVPIFLSGGLHMDGFADFCDGFFSGKDKAGILHIMRDPHVGTWAVVGLALLLLSKWEALKIISFRPVFFLLALSAGRWAQVVFSCFFDYARAEGGLGQSVAKKARNTELIIASLFLAPLVVWAGKAGVIVFAVHLCFLFLFGLFVQRKIGGITGDVLGAVSELSEWVIIMTAVCL